MKGDLTEPVTKDGRDVHPARSTPTARSPRPTAARSCERGRSLMLVRNVGHLMTTPAVLDADGRGGARGPARRGGHRAVRPATTCATARRAAAQLAGRARSTSSSRRCTAPPRWRSPTRLFTAVEQLLGLPRQHREDRDHGRGAAHDASTSPSASGPPGRRVVFINTGFLDRTGDEIHTSMQAGPMVRKADMRTRDLDPGLRGLERRRRAGLRAARAGPRSARACGRRPTSWPTCSSRRSATPRPAPTAPGCRRRRRPRCTPPTTTASTSPPASRSSPRVRVGRRASLDDLLAHPARRRRPTGPPRRSQAEVDNNAQGILGYVVRWVDQGVGCSKVPDINDVGLMEDRATCRISSQHIANWLLHGVVTADQVRRDVPSGWRAWSTPRTPAIRPTCRWRPSFDGPAFSAACDLVFAGLDSRPATPSRSSTPAASSGRAPGTAEE